jgi:HTH-type transcriptional regulator/antitoxin MqsA
MRTPPYCLQCDDGTLLEYGRRDLAFTYHGNTLTVSALQGWHCPICGECEFDEGEGQRYGAAVDAFAAEVDAEEAAWLRSTRKKLKLKQAEAGKLFGGGISAFSEYERGKTQPHKSTVLLLRLLDKHPELLKELVELPIQVGRNKPAHTDFDNTR